MPADYSFIARPPETNSLGSIANVLGIAGKAQEIQRGGVALQLERELLQPKIEQGKAESERAKTEALKAVFGLTKEQASAAHNIAAGLFRDQRIVSGDHAGTIDALVEARKDAIANGVPAHMAEGMFSELISQARTPGAVLQRLQNITQAQAGPGTRAGVLNAPLAPIPTGGNTTFGQLQPGAIGGGLQHGQFLPNTIPPTQREQTAADPLGNTFVVPRDPSGAIQPVRPLPGSQPVGGNQPQPFAQMAPGQAQDIPIITKIRSDINQAAAKVPEQRFNNREIIALAPESFTGTAADLWAQVFSLVDPNWNFREKSEAANYQRLAHFMALQTQANASAMGAGTDQARAISQEASGNPNWTREAIISTAKINDAFSSGLSAFNQGMENAIRNANGNVLAAREFQNKWSRAFDPDVFRFINAVEAKDKKEQDKITGGSEKKKAELADKYLALKRLWESGQ